MKVPFNTKHFLVTILIVSIWINASEVFRYFVLVIPKVKDYWNNLESIADMNWIIFSIWGLWDTLLTTFIVFISWLCFQVFDKIKSIAIASLLGWMLFVLFWIAAANMGFSSWSLLWITLPLGLFEMIIATYICYFIFTKKYHYV